MAIAYLDNKAWWKWSRDERMYCAVLWEHGRAEPGKFARWLNKEAKLGIDTAGSWDLAYEVVFYRDFLWQKKRSATKENFHPKRTFDLCLFGEKHLVIIEAKMCGGFQPEQVKIFKNDKKDLKRAMKKNAPSIHIVGLACSEYWRNLDKYGSKITKDFFKHRITWKEVDNQYPDKILAEADGIYRKELDRKKKT